MNENCLRPSYFSSRLSSVAASYSILFSTEKGETWRKQRSILSPLVVKLDHLQIMTKYFLLLRHSLPISSISIPHWALSFCFFSLSVQYFLTISTSNKILVVCHPLEGWLTKFHETLKKSLSLDNKSFVLISMCLFHQSLWQLNSILCGDDNHFDCSCSFFRH